MTILIIDTSTERGLIALGTPQGTIIKEKRLAVGHQKNNQIFLAFKELEVNPKTLRLIICAVGPGSYTGTRGGAIVAKTLSYANQIPLVGVCTLDGFPAPALIDAKTGGAYILHNGQWTRTPLEHALEVVGTDIVYTPNAALLKAKAPQVNWTECYPSAEKYLQLGLGAGEGSKDGTLLINY